MFIIPKNDFLNILAVVVFLMVFFYRCWDVFIKRYGVSGRIYHKWTLPLLSLWHTLIGLFAVAEYFFILKNYNVAVGVIATALFFAGQIIRNKAILALGVQHSPHIEIKPNHQLIDSGLYARIRHPYYLGVILEVVMTPLIWNSYYACVFALLVYVPTLLIRIKLEEDTFQQHFGGNFRNYRARVPGFFPKSFC